MALQRRGFSKTAAKDPKIHNQSTNQHNQHTQGIHSSKHPGPQVSSWRLVAVFFKCIFCFYQVELCCNNNLKSLMIFDRRGNLPNLFAGSIRSSPTHGSTLGRQSMLLESMLLRTVCVWMAKKRRMRERRSLATIVTLNLQYILTLAIEKNQRLIIK